MNDYFYFTCAFEIGLWLNGRTDDTNAACLYIHIYINIYMTIYTDIQ